MKTEMSSGQKDSPEDYFEATIVWDKLIEEYEAKIAECRAKKSAIFEKMLADYGKSFEFGGKYFTIKYYRKTNSYILHSFPVPPGSWLKKEDPENNVAL